MNTSDIKILLEKYWDCDTSIEEELQLKSYFSKSDIAPELASYSDLFSLISTQSTLKTSVSLPDTSTLEIHDILDKYWACTADLNEEATLKSYFAGNDIDKSLLPFTDLFQVLHSESKLTVGNIAIERTVEDTSPSVSKPKKSFSIPTKWIAVAASLLLVSVLWFNTDVLNPQSETAFAEYAVQSEEEALEVTMEALAFLSGKLDKSSNKIKNDIKRVSNASLLK